MPTKRSGDIVAEIKKLDAFPALMLVSSADRIRKQRLLEVCFTHFFAGAKPPEVRRIDATDLTLKSLTSLADELHAQSLFSKREIIIIQQVEELDAACAKALAQILEGPQLAVDVVLWGDALPAAHALKKLCVKRSAVFELPELKGPTLKRWCEKELKLNGVGDIGDTVVDLLLSLSGGSLDVLHALCEHCGLYADGGKLNSADLHKLFVEQIEPSEFELVDTLQSSNRARVELLLQQTIESGKSPFALIGLISRVFANYLSIAHLLKQGRTPADIRNELGLTPWILNKTLPVAKKYSVSRLAQIQRQILRADSKLKNKSLGNDLVLAQLLSELRP